ncbi:ubiquitin-like small modifier protein 2 [Natrialbaceae archaeon GCM10025810]|uniref:ubiquitin-like small modifier protein SAMP2 n=1 Tax=Halovalidus salilacus TaxID=3075124 RepID=UPI00361E2DC2
MPDDDRSAEPDAETVTATVTVDVKGEDVHELALEDVSSGGSEATYADLLAAVGLSPHEVTVLVDGRPVPEDQPVAVDRVTVLRLIKGG